MIFENFAKIANLGKDKNENFKCQIFYGKHFILTPFKGAENRFSISCLVCATELTKYTTYEEKLHWEVLRLFRGVYKRQTSAGALR